MKPKPERRSDCNDAVNYFKKKNSTNPIPKADDFLAAVLVDLSIGRIGGAYETLINGFIMHPQDAVLRDYYCLFREMLHGNPEVQAALIAVGKELKNEGRLLHGEE